LYKGRQNEALSATWGFLPEIIRLNYINMSNIWLLIIILSAVGLYLHGTRRQVEPFASVTGPGCHWKTTGTPYKTWTNNGIPPDSKFLPNETIPQETSSIPQVPPPWKWKPYINYYYYDPWWSQSYPYNQLCEAYARRDCSKSWYPRECYRRLYNKCVTEKIY
jgi:hypothetical protein